MPASYKAGSFEGAPGFRWKKMFRGTMYRVTCEELGLPREKWTREGSYQAANQWWENKRRQLEALPIDPAQTETEERLNWARENEPDEVPELERLLKAGISEDESTVALTLDLLRQQGATIELPDDIDTQLVKEVFGNARVWQERRSRSKGVSSPTTLTRAVSEFLCVIQGQVKPKTYRELSEYLGKLPSTLPNDPNMIDEDTVSKIFADLSRATLSASTRKKRWSFFKRFIRFLYEGNRCILPRNLDSAMYRFDVRPQAIKTHTPDEVKAILAALPERLKLFALLGLNTGMTNADMGALTQDAVEGGYLTRRRVKTGETKNVPTVTYKLWNETQRLLTKFRSKDKVYWLTSSTGTPLVANRVEEGQTKEKDLVAKAWLKANCPIMLKEFRSIGATMLESHKDYGRYVSYFLAHSPASIKDKHYAAPSQSVFDEALTWLGEQVA